MLPAEELGRYAFLGVPLFQRQPRSPITTQLKEHVEPTHMYISTHYFLLRSSSTATGYIHMSRWQVAGVLEGFAEDDDLNYQDVTFNRSSKTWLCCVANGSNITCDDPTTETVSAKVLASIATTYVVPASVATTVAITTSGAHTTAPTNSRTATPKTTSSDSSSRTSASAIARGVVGGVLLIAILVGVWFFCGRARAMRERVGVDVLMPSAQGLLNGHFEKAPDAESLELQTHENPVELSTSFEQTQTHERESVASELP